MCLKLSIFNNNIVFILLYPLKEQLLHRLTSQEQGREKDIIGKELEVRYMKSAIYYSSMAPIYINMLLLPACN